MERMKIIEGGLSARDLRIGIVAARFNEFVVESLLRGAVDCFRRHGGEERDLTLVRVPGAWEIPLAVDRLAAAGDVDAVVVLGAVIRGATPHFDFVAAECAKGVSAAGAKHGMPVGFGVLTTDSIEQALERAGTKAGNKGADAMLGAVEMANLLRQMDA